MGRFTNALKAEIGSYENTEWSGKLGGIDANLFAKPITSADISRISRKFPDFAQNPSPEGMVEMMILKCLDENDDKAFDVRDKNLLMNVGTNKLGEIFGALFGGQMDEYTEDDLETDIKN